MDLADILGMVHDWMSAAVYSFTFNGHYYEFNFWQTFICIAVIWFGLDLIDFINHWIWS